jgi:hypothetical protein
MEKFTIRINEPFHSREKKLKIKDCLVQLRQWESDPENAIRIQIDYGNVSMELFPSKFLAIGDVFIGGTPILWEAPIGLSDPDKLDLSSNEILFNGEPREGFTFLKTFVGGIEFYGMKNWGMPHRNAITGELYLLHGETASIPVDEVIGFLYEDRLEMSGKITYKEFDFKGKKAVWYKTGRALYEIIHTIVIPKDGNSFKSVVRVTNITKKVLVPDWGRHITLRPSNGSRLMLASKSIEERSGDKVPDDFEYWFDPKNPCVRTENGIIHKGLKVYDDNGKKFNKALMLYPSGRSVCISFPPSPYFQTWFCSGGANSDEFTFAETGKPVFSKNWDAQGIEFGASALDHNDNIDKEVPFKRELNPDESFENEIEVKLLDNDEKEWLYNDIGDYIQNRVVK